MKCAGILIIFLMFSPVCRADSGKIDLESKYGPQLDKAPFFLRYSFSKEYNEDWKESTYEERKGFLTDYETDVMLQKQEAESESRLKAEKQKERERQKVQEEQDKNNRLKEEQSQKQAEEQADTQRQKSLDEAVKDQERSLEEMRRNTYA